MSYRCMWKWETMDRECTAVDVHVIYLGVLAAAAAFQETQKEILKESMAQMLQFAKISACSVYNI